MIKNKQKVICFVGTRPEAIKMAPVVRELKSRRDRFDVLLCSTGQHREMLSAALKDFDLIPDIDLDVMTHGQSLASLSAALFPSIDAVLAEHNPDWILVQGDTTTVTVAAQCAFYRKIKIAHVEAGLRTYDKWAPFPEEVNRRIAGLLATLHFPPTEQSYRNLLDEAVPEASVLVTGNTVIDALLWMVERVRMAPPELPSEVEVVLRSGKPYVLITGHRRENFGEGFRSVCLAIRDLAISFPEYAFIYPVHLNPNVQAPVNELLLGVPGVYLIPPQTYKPFLRLMDNCQLILTDSGGVQEEAPSLGKPVLVMRDVTERPEGVLAGASRLVGANRDSIVSNVTNLIKNKDIYEKMKNVSNPYGDGTASIKIANSLENYFQ